MMMNNYLLKIDQVTKNHDEPCTMAAFSSNFYESKNLFQELNISPHTGSLVGDTSNGSGPTRKTRDHSRNMELEKYICKHGKIPISITLGAEKSISSHVVLFSNTISVAIRDAFPIWLLRFADVPSKYIKIVKKFMKKVERLGSIVCMRLLLRCYLFFTSANSLH
ncbi:(R)-mandelonitrile lyase 1-like [Cucumis melo var. makuwa]|uniref:(R)-mandelonitrile lyase 1-like n=1 Tax=Cucumis melo var. makuwa TaxID=1194695 RepID=A0A5D3BVT3_CUCMM|nr:(R)-mandelonitrile lyase 1-like [Cucumis melo var. makuwa]TYK02199.1 (R)-mandelonitrile lyase 1-like [Cucumis melo var. makuwa]